jgi:hypothetical protein
VDSAAAFSHLVKEVGIYFTIGIAGLLIIAKLVWVIVKSESKEIQTDFADLKHKASDMHESMKDPDDPKKLKKRAQIFAEFETVHEKLEGISVILDEKCQPENCPMAHTIKNLIDSTREENEKERAIRREKDEAIVAHFARISDGLLALIRFTVEKVGGGNGKVSRSGGTHNDDFSR